MSTSQPSSEPAPESPSEQLQQLAAAHGVATDFWDFTGTHRAVPAHTIRAVLAALGHDEVPVELASGQQRLMSLDQLRTWPLVREGVFSADLADLLVERLFAEDGSEMAARLELGPGKDGA